MKIFLYIILSISLSLIYIYWEWNDYLDYKEDLTYIKIYLSEIRIAGVDLIIECNKLDYERNINGKK
jgi:hypothetical protein